MGTKTTKSSELVIENNIDISEYQGEQVYFVGANEDRGIICGHIKNTLKASSNRGSAGAFSGVSGGGGNTGKRLGDG